MPRVSEVIDISRKSSKKNQIRAKARPPPQTTEREKQCGDQRPRSSSPEIGTGRERKKIVRDDPGLAEKRGKGSERQRERGREN